MSTETITKRRMMAELIFPHPAALSLASCELTRLGFEVRQLPDWVDEYGYAVWLVAFFDYDGTQEDFLNWTGGLASDHDGDVIEAGYEPDDVEAWIAAKS